jgi:MtN3 and saliva related transmembrane protein
MDYTSVNTSIGLAAAACTTASFIPQLVKLHRQGGRDLSYGMLLLYMLGVVLWLTYGLRIRAAEVVLANIAAGALVSAAVIMKRRSERPRDESAAREAQIAQ